MLQSGTLEPARGVAIGGDSDRAHTLEALDGIFRRLLSAFPSDFRRSANQGSEITPRHIRNYLASHAHHFADVIEQVLRWAPGKHIAEVGVAYGATLLCLRDVYGYHVHAFELPENIPALCRGLQAEGVDVEGWDLYDVAAAENGERAFDFLICSEVVEHLFVDLATVVERMRPRVRVGGRLLLTTPNLYRLSNLFYVCNGRNICEAHPDVPTYQNGHVVDGRGHPREYAVREVAQAFADVHWHLHRIWTVGATSCESWRCRVLARLLRSYLPYPLGQMVFAVAERVG